MTLKRATLVSGLISTRSMAPGAARWPELICAPSKAGPVGEEQASTLSLLPKQDLGIGADIDNQHQILGFVRGLGQRHGGSVRTYMTGDAGQDIDPRAGVDFQIQLNRAQLQSTRR